MEGFPAVTGFFLFATTSRPVLRPTKLPIQLVLEIKQLWREAEHSPSSRAEVKNMWKYTIIPPYAFMAWCLIKHRDKFTFYLCV
jgi:hypothetical protein